MILFTCSDRLNIVTLFAKKYGLYILAQNAKTNTTHPVWPRMSKPIPHSLLDWSGPECQNQYHTPYQTGLVWPIRSKPIYITQPTGLVWPRMPKPTPHAQEWCHIIYKNANIQCLKPYRTGLVIVKLNQPRMPKPTPHAQECQNHMPHYIQECQYPMPHPLPDWFGNSKTEPAQNARTTTPYATNKAYTTSPECQKVSRSKWSSNLGHHTYNVGAKSRWAIDKQASRKWIIF